MSRSNRGAALVLTIGIMLVVSILVSAILMLKMSDLNQMRLHLRQLEASYIAQAGVEHAIYWLRMYKAPVWQWGDPTYLPTTCYSESNCWGTRLNENYRNNLASAYGIERLVTPGISITSANPYLRFYFQWRRGNSGDTAIVKQSTDNAVTYPTTLTTLNESSSWANSFSQQLTVSAGSTLMISFEINTDSNLTGSGLYIDNICVSSGTGCTGTKYFEDNCEDGVGNWWYQIMLAANDPANFPTGTDYQFYDTIDSTFATTDTYIIKGKGKRGDTISNAEAKIQLSGSSPPYLVNVLYYKRGL